MISQQSLNAPLFTPKYSHIPLPNAQFTEQLLPAQEQSTVVDTQHLSFTDLLAISDLPPPGPAHYAARRALWLTPRSIQANPPPTLSTSRRRLQKLLESPNAVNDDRVWNDGVEKAWKGLNAGGRLKRRLPMGLVIKIIHSAWVRDNTWPAGASAPDPDDVLMEDIPPNQLLSGLVGNF